MRRAFIPPALGLVGTSGSIFGGCRSLASLRDTRHARQAFWASWHRDPFDRLLVAQAQIEAMRLLTADRQLEPCEIDIEWADAWRPDGTTGQPHRLHPSHR